MGNLLGNTSRYLHNTVYNDVVFFSSTFSKFGIALSGRSLSPYNLVYRNNTGLPDVINYFSYIMWELLMVPLGNSYRASIILFGRSFWIRFMCTESVTLIVSPMHNACGAFKK